MTTSLDTLYFEGNDSCFRDPANTCTRLHDLVYNLICFFELDKAILN